MAAGIGLDGPSGADSGRRRRARPAGRRPGRRTMGRRQPATERVGAAQPEERQPRGPPTAFSSSLQFGDSAPSQNTSTSPVRLIAASRDSPATGSATVPGSARRGMFITVVVVSSGVATKSAQSPAKPCVASSISASTVASPCRSSSRSSSDDSPGRSLGLTASFQARDARTSSRPPDHYHITGMHSQCPQCEPLMNIHYDGIADCLVRIE